MQFLLFSFIYLFYSFIFCNKSTKYKYTLRCVFSWVLSLHRPIAAASSEPSHGVYCLLTGRHAPIAFEIRQISTSPKHFWRQPQKSTWFVSGCPVILKKQPVPSHPADGKLSIVIQGPWSVKFTRLVTNVHCSVSQVSGGWAESMVLMFDVPTLYKTKTGQDLLRNEVCQVLSDPKVLKVRHDTVKQNGVMQACNYFCVAFLQGLLSVQVKQFYHTLSHNDSASEGLPAFPDPSRHCSLFIPSPPMLGLLLPCLEISKFAAVGSASLHWPTLIVPSEH